MMIKKYVLGLLLICVAFAGWGQEEISLGLSYTEYSYDIYFPRKVLYNAVIVVDDPNDNKLFFNQFGDIISTSDLDIQLLGLINSYKNLGLKTLKYSQVFDIDQNDHFHERFQHPIDFNFEYKNGNGHKPNWEQVSKLPIQKIQNYLVHTYPDSFGSGLGFHIFLYNESQFTRLYMSLPIESFPGEADFLKNISSGGNLDPNKLNDYRVEILARALAFKDTENELNFDNNFYNSIKSSFYSNLNFTDLQLKQNISFNGLAFSDVPSGALNETDLNTYSLYFRQYITEMLKNSMDIEFDKFDLNRSFPIVTYDKAFVDALYSSNKSYLFYYFSYLYNNDYPVLSSLYQKATSYGEQKNQYFDPTQLSEITSQQGERLADSALLYILINNKLSNGKNDVKYRQLYNEWKQDNENGVNERLFNYAFTTSEGNSISLQWIEDDNTGKQKLSIDSAVVDPLAPLQKETNEIQDKGIPYANQGIDTPFLYLNKAYNPRLNNGNPITELGVDSYGMLMGAISMNPDISEYYYSVLGNRPGENINALNNLSKYFSLSNYLSLEPLRTKDGLNWNTESNQLTRILYNELSLNNFDIERNTKVVPSYAEAQVGDIFVQYGVINKHFKDDASFRAYVESAESTDYQSSVGMIVHIEQPDNLNNRRFWVLSVRAHDGACTLKPYDKYTKYNNVYAQNPDNYVLRRLLVSEEDAPVSKILNEHRWALVESSKSQITAETNVVFYKTEDKDKVKTWYTHNGISLTGEKATIDSIDFKLSNNYEPGTIDVEIISPADPWFGYNDPNLDNEIYKNKDGYWIEFGFNNTNFNGLFDEEPEDLITDWLVRFEKKPMNLLDENGLDNYYIHYNPTYFENKNLKAEYRLFLQEIQNKPNVTHTLNFKSNENHFQHFYVSVKDPDNLNSNFNIANNIVGDDFVLRFFLSDYNISTDLMYDGVTKGRVYGGGNADFDNDKILNEYILSKSAIDNRLTIDFRLDRLPPEEPKSWKILTDGYGNYFLEGKGTQELLFGDHVLISKTEFASIKKSTGNSSDYLLFLEILLGAEAEDIAEVMVKSSMLYPFMNANYFSNIDNSVFPTFRIESEWLDNILDKSDQIGLDHDAFENVDLSSDLLHFDFSEITALVGTQLQSQYKKNRIAQKELDEAYDAAWQHFWDAKYNEHAAIRDVIINGTESLTYASATIAVATEIFGMPKPGEIIADVTTFFISNPVVANLEVSKAYKASLALHTSFAGYLNSYIYSQNATGKFLKNYGYEYDDFKNITEKGLELFKLASSYHDSWYTLAEGPRFEQGLRGFGQAVLDFTPVLGDISAIAEGVFGIQTITREELTPNERSAGIAFTFGSLAFDVFTAVKATQRTGSTLLELAYDNVDNTFKRTINGFSSHALSVTRSAAKSSAKYIDDVAEALMDGAQYTKSGRIKVLKPDISYVSSGGHLYKTDSLGRITSVNGSNLELITAPRNKYAQSVAGRGDRIRRVDHGGHLIASRFNGSGDLDNLVAMDGSLNINAWKDMETDWADAIKRGETVDVNIKIEYDDISLRPLNFRVEYYFDGILIEKLKFNNF